MMKTHFDGFKYSKNGSTNQIVERKTHKPYDYFLDGGDKRRS